MNTVHLQKTTIGGSLPTLEDSSFNLTTGSLRQRTHWVTDRRLQIISIQYLDIK